MKPDRLDALTSEYGRAQVPDVVPYQDHGTAQDGFAQAMLDVVLKHAPDFDPATLEMRASRKATTFR